MVWRAHLHWNTTKGALCERLIMLNRDKHMLTTIIISASKRIRIIWGWNKTWNVETRQLQRWISGTLHCPMIPFNVCFTSNKLATNLNCTPRATSTFMLAGIKRSPSKYTICAFVCTVVWSYEASFSHFKDLRCSANVNELQEILDLIWIWTFD